MKKEQDYENLTTKGKQDFWHEVEIIEVSEEETVIDEDEYPL